MDLEINSFHKLIYTYKIKKMSDTVKLTGRVLALDVSTSTIGIALFENNGKLLELTHIAPKIKPQPKNKTEELFRKVDAFEEFIKRYSGLNIEKVVIEEPLLNSNNVYTIATLLRFNGMISKVTDNILKVVPDFISSYDSRKYAFPELMAKRTVNKKGIAYTEKEIEKSKEVLFGAYPWEIDKKVVIFNKVCEREPQLPWDYDKHGKIRKESYDMSDAYTCGLAWLKLNNYVKD